MAKTGNILKSTKATFTLVVEYDELPPDSELEDLTERAQEYGAVQKAELVITTPVKKTYN